MLLMSKLTERSKLTRPEEQDTEPRLQRQVSDITLVAFVLIKAETEPLGPTI